MAFLTLNGIELGGDIAADSLPEPRREIGETSSAFNGTLRKSRQAIKRDIEFSTTPLTSADALAWESFLQGLGEHWGFNTSLYGSKGTGPNSGYVASNPSGTPKFGAAVLRVTASTGSITYAAALGSNWTAMFWRYESAVWHHYTVLSDGKKWLDGVRADATVTTWFAVSGGSAALTNVTGAAVDYDDLVLLPFLVPTTWPEAFGVAASAFSELPKLTAAGDIIQEASTRTVLGEATPSALKVHISGTLRTNARTLAVKLMEV
jgi:hypothetical protein